MSKRHWLKLTQYDVPPGADPVIVIAADSIQYLGRVFVGGRSTGCLIGMHSGAISQVKEPLGKIIEFLEGLDGTRAFFIPREDPE
jgi:hypothetical protein